MLEDRVNQELEISDNFLDPDIKWLYAKKGTEVFALYGVGDGTEATVLYVVGGNKVQLAYRNTLEFLGGYENGSTSNWAAVDRMLEALQNKQSRKPNGVYRTGNRGTATILTNKSYCINAGEQI